MNKLISSLIPMLLTWAYLIESIAPESDGKKLNPKVMDFETRKSFAEFCNANVRLSSMEEELFAALDKAHKNGGTCNVIDVDQIQLAKINADAKKEDEEGYEELTSTLDNSSAAAFLTKALTERNYADVVLACQNIDYDTYILVSGNLYDAIRLLRIEQA
tara:strand:+ start:4434 stop:4913 length:480 start_codon:yes stop_codon:yes gene_type:complete